MSYGNAILPALSVALAVVFAGCESDFSVSGSETERLQVQGQVRSIDGDVPVPGATVQPCSELQIPGSDWCGVEVQTDVQGEYSFGETILPRYCPIEIRVSAPGFQSTEGELDECPGVNQIVDIVLEPESS